MLQEKDINLISVKKKKKKNYDKKKILVWGCMKISKISMSLFLDN